MAIPQFTTVEHPEFTLVEFAIPGGVISPEELPEVEPPGVTASKGVVLSGRGPVYLFAFLAHQYHPTAWIGTFAPAEGGAVVFETHSLKVRVGQVVPVPKPE